MKKCFVIIAMLFLLAFSCFAPKLQIAHASSMDDNPTITMSELSHNGGEIKVRVNLTNNTGICDMLLELVYDADVMGLANVERGDALSSLSFITTNPNTELGYKITPFKFLYSSDTYGENDFSTGVLFVLTFNFNENIKNGNYNISLKYERDKGVNYYTSEGFKTKNLFIDGLDIKIQNNSITQIASDGGNQSTIGDKNSSDIWIIVVPCSIVVIIIAAFCVVIAIEKRNNRKKK